MQKGFNHRHKKTRKVRDPAGLSQLCQRGGWRSMIFNSGSR